MKDRRALLVVSGILLIGFLVLVTRPEDAGTPIIAPQASSQAPPTSTGPTEPPVVFEEKGRRQAVDIVMAYWAVFGNGDAAAVELLLDMAPDQATKEVGLVEYSAAFGGEYVATCVAGAVVDDEVAVNCEVGSINQPLAEALGVGVTPTQFRVRGDKITRVGYLKPYSVIDLRLAAFVRPANEDSFIEACSDPEGIYLADAGVVYNSGCGSFMASFTDEYIAFLD